MHVDDLDQPRSAALRERLLTMLDSPARERRRAAALALSRWPEPEARLPVLRAFLRGRVDVPVGAGLARALTAIGEGELRADEVLHDRVALAASHLDAGDLEPLVPLLLEWWEHDPPSSGSAVGRALRAVPADVLAERLGDRLAAGAWGFLDLLRGRPLLRTPRWRGPVGGCVPRGATTSRTNCSWPTARCAARTRWGRTPPRWRRSAAASRRRRRGRRRPRRGRS